MTNLEFEDIKNVAELPYRWDNLNNKTILISGGTGFIGSFLINIFKYRNEYYNSNIRVISLSRNGGDSDSTVQNLKCDITEKINYEKNVDYVIHLASNTHPKQYDMYPVETITTNVIGCNNLLQFSLLHGVKRFLLASSVEIYGQGNDVSMDEKYCGYLDCNNARNGYNEAKRTCEALCQSYIKQYGLDCIIARLARVYGADKKNDSKALSQFMKSALGNENIILKSNGKQQFSYCYISDAGSALIKLLLDGINGEAYNVAADYDGNTLGDYAVYIAALANRKVKYEIEDNDSVSKASYAVLDTQKIKELGWKPKKSVLEGIKNTYYIYKSREKQRKTYK